MKSPDADSWCYPAGRGAARAPVPQAARGRAAVAQAGQDVAQHAVHLPGRAEVRHLCAPGERVAAAGRPALAAAAALAGSPGALWPV